MKTDAAAMYITSNAKTMEGWRQKGSGPRFFKAGRRVVYEQSVLDAWLDSHGAVSTAESKRIESELFDASVA